MDLTQRIVNSSTLRAADEMAVRSHASADSLDVNCDFFIVSAFIFFNCSIPFAEKVAVPVYVVS